MEKISEDDEQDFVFRYPLETGELPECEPVYADRLVEMLREQLKNILDLVVPVCDGRDVKIDGFRLIKDEGRIYRIFNEYRR